ncbi:hypothetical protein [Halapricum salinum]|uniref:Uncharacterized protein n=1 Tax=Halapricum salinum TaxID=1457250 RepID=A0A4D6H9Y3_9EURY|nr:hypothetical protein [Halapricum salinum]QCC49852.1 hypothetical protein DV733_00820 [Halapricum salinum]
MERRTVLRSAGVAACLVAGCAGSPATRLAHHVSVRNWTESSRALGVIVEGESETLFNHRYDLESGTHRGGYGFYGEANTIAVIVDGYAVQEFEFDDASCTGRDLVGLVLTLTESGTVDLAYECAIAEDPTPTNGNASRP